MKKVQICILFWSIVGENDDYVIYCFVDCGYRTNLLIIWHVFYYFFINSQFWNTKFQDVNEKNMNHLLVPKPQQSWGKSGGQKKWSGQAPLRSLPITILRVVKELADYHFKTCIKELVDYHFKSCMRNLPITILNYMLACKFDLMILISNHCLSLNALPTYQDPHMAHIKCKGHQNPTLCPTSRLDVMSHAVDCVKRVTSCLILKLDREYAMGTSS